MEQNKHLPLCKKCQKEFNRFYQETEFKGKTLVYKGTSVPIIGRVNDCVERQKFDLCNECIKAEIEEERKSYIKDHPEMECPGCGYMFTPIFENFPLNKEYCEECFKKIIQQEEKGREEDDAQTEKLNKQFIHLVEILYRNMDMSTPKIVLLITKEIPNWIPILASTSKEMIIKQFSHFGDSKITAKIVEIKDFLSSKESKEQQKPEVKSPWIPPELVDALILFLSCYRAYLTDKEFFEKIKLPFLAATQSNSTAHLS